MGASESSISKATSLLAERRKYEGWLAALGQRRATTPERVFTRVHADYLARLEAVVAELADNADALEARVRELAERAEALETESQAILDERAEAELRAHVGELEAEAWDRAAGEADKRLEALTRERGSLEEELGSIRELLAAARTPTPSAAVAAVASPAPSDIGAEEDPGQGSPADGVSGEEPEARPAEVTGEGAAAGEAPAAVGVPSEKPSGGFDELAFLRDITGVTPEGPVGAVGADEGAAPRRGPERPVDDSLGLVLPNDEPAITPTHRASTEVPMAANVASNVPLVIKPEASRPGKTLKCTECGSMNYPTEWYCERCGAELSAL